MVTPDLLAAGFRHLQGAGGEGQLWLHCQSNCEDVAVMMRNTALMAGFREKEMSSARLENLPTAAGGIPTQRTLNWTEQNKEAERATGSGWSSSPLLPREAMTATEVACMIRGVPVHRCVLVASAPVVKRSSQYSCDHPMSP